MNEPAEEQPDPKTIARFPRHPSGGTPEPGSPFGDFSEGSLFAKMALMQDAEWMREKREECRDDETFSKR